MMSHRFNFKRPDITCFMVYTHRLPMFLTVKTIGLLLGGRLTRYPERFINMILNTPTINYSQNYNP